MKRILSVGAALAALVISQQAFATDYCVGSTNGVANLGTGSAVPPPNECQPGGSVNQQAQNALTQGFFNVSAADIFNGVISATFGRSGIASSSGAEVTDRFLFTIPQNGVGSGSVTTSFSDISNQLHLDAVFINGISVPITSLLSGQAASDAGIPILTGVQNVLEIEYTAIGSNSSYGGQLTFVPLVPEPATWALMLAGFGAIGFAMRRQRKPEPKVRFAF
jgi:hypothetical protein